MLTKTRGIVLSHLPYNDHSIVVHLYTEKFGRQAYWVRGTHSRRSSFKASLFQPLFLLELESYHKPHQLQKLKEVRNYPVYTTVPFDIHKTTLSLFLAEVLYRSLREEEANEALYHFLSNSLLALDLETEQASNFHLYFLLKLTRYLGFSPSDNYSVLNGYFDYHNGEFVNYPPMHNQFLDKTLSGYLHFFLSKSYEECMQLPLNAEIRVLLLGKIIEFYNFHFEGICKIHSLNILKEVYHF